MLNEQHDIETELHADAVVIGGGLAGLAATIHLARGGLNVISLEPYEDFTNIIGESLDWSAPDLLAQLGLSMDQLCHTGAATLKRHITIAAIDGLREEFLPGSWLGERPWNVELRTLHLDRRQVHIVLQELVRVQGTITLRERGIGFEMERDRILSVMTSGGRTIRTRWVVDASGAAASVLGREFSLPSASYGPRKIALWAHFPTEEWVEGTNLYTLSSPGEYMEWIWEIPVRPGVSSIGYVAPGSRAKIERAAGLTNIEILSKQMEKFPRLHEIAQRSPVQQVAATSFLCRTYHGVCGPNWIIVGEAASQSDPITGNGVTAALRHAEEGSALICRYRHREAIPTLARLAYNLRVSALGRYFNSLIEKLYYESRLRSLLGIFLTARVYTVPAWSANLLYSRTRPRGVLGTLVFCTALVTLRGLAWGMFRISGLLHRRKHKLHEFVPAALDAGGGGQHAFHSAR